MLKKRLIAVLILRDGQVVQSVKFKHTNVIHYDPVHAMEAFNKWSVDEIVMLNVDREPTKFDTFVKVIQRISRVCFVPLSVGGWIQNGDMASLLLHAGADKLVINSTFFTNPDLPRTLSLKYGRQCIVGSIDVQRDESGTPHVVVDRGRQPVGSDPVSWAERLVEYGAGEIFYNSVDHDGSRKGYDIEVLQELTKRVDVPVIAFGGVLTWKHLLQGIEAGADAVAAANVFHYKEQATRKAKSYLSEHGVPVRSEGQFGSHPIRAEH